MSSEIADHQSEQVRECLARIVTSDLFRSSARQRRFLEYIVEETLAGRGARLGGYGIALEVFDRPASFDPATDSIVRVEAGRLRSKLVEYYSREDLSDAIEIVLPRGHYRPEFRARAAVNSAVSHLSDTRAGVARVASVQTQGIALAVLPFENLNGGPARDYFATGLADDLVNALLKVNGLVVLSRHATARLPPLADPRQTAASLQVDHLLTGTVRYAGEQIRVAVELIEGSSGRSLWSHHYDDNLHNVFEALDRIVIAVAGFLKDALTPAEHTRLAQRGTRNLAAFEEYMQGAYLATQPDASDEWVARCAAHYRKASEFDPNFGEALARLSRLELAGLGNGRGDPATVAVQLWRTAARAVEVSPHSALCQVTLANALVVHGRYDEAIARALDALKLAPGSSEIAAVGGLVLAQSGRLAEGHALLEESLRTEKLVNPFHAWAAGMVYFAAAEYPRGRDVLQEILQHVPKLVVANLLLAAYHMMLGESAQAIAQIHRVAKEGPLLLQPRAPWSGISQWRDSEIRERVTVAVESACRAAGVTP